jgi:tetrahydrodipicolinate N-succinyltransferase/predicted DNA-binding WGR domain protein
MREKIITPKSYREGMAKMMHFVDAAKNHSKFYEMAIIPDGYGTYTLIKCYGALTDDPNKVTVLTKNNQSLEDARLQMEVKTREQLGKGYSNTFKTHNGEYPLGLDRKGPFNHGTQSAYSKPEALAGLQAILVDLDLAIEAGDRMDANRMSASLAEVGRHLFDLSDSSMARKLEQKLAVPARQLLDGTAKPSAIARSLKVLRNAIARQFTEVNKRASVEVNVRGKHLFGGATVEDNAMVFGNAKVLEHAEVFDDAQVHGKATVNGNAKVSGKAQVFHNAWVFGDARISGNARVFDSARVYDDATIISNAKVYGDAYVYGDALLYENAKVYDRAHVYGNAKVSGNAHIFGDADISGNAVILGGEWDGSEGPIKSGKWKGPGIPA